MVKEASWGEVTLEQGMKNEGGDACLWKGGWKMYFRVGARLSRSVLTALGAVWGLKAVSEREQP